MPAGLVCRNLVIEAELRDVGTIEVRRSVTGRQAARIVAVVEESKTARGIERVRPGVGELIIEPVPGLLMQGDEQGVVVRPAHRGPLDRVRAIADIRYPEIGVSSSVGLIRLGEKRPGFFLP